MSTSSRAYSAGKFLIELDGKPVGFASSVEGGEAFADVIADPSAADGTVPKHLGPVRYAPITVAFGTGMDPAVYAWMSQFLAGKREPKDGAIVMLDYHYAERLRLEWLKGLITEVRFPLLDATAKHPAAMGVTFQPQVSDLRKGSGTTVKTAIGPKVQTKWLGSNFRLQIAGLEGPTAKVNRVEPIVIAQPLAGQEATFVAGDLDVRNVVFTVSEAASDPLYEWLQDFVVKGNNGSDHERSGTLEFLDVQQHPLFTAALKHVGIVRIQKERTEDNVNVIARVRVELYCEEIEFAHDVASEGVAVSVITTPAHVRAPGGVRPVPRLRLPSIRTRSAEVRSGFEPEAVARRLVAAARTLEAARATHPLREDGRALGESWAAQQASVGELQGIAGLDGGEWTALTLDPDHSLLERLRADGVLPKEEAGPIDLQRDDFVESLVSGAAGVYGKVTPLLGRLSLRPIPE
jgi:hypothetical protein